MATQQANPDTHLRALEELLGQAERDTSLARHRLETCEERETKLREQVEKVRRAWQPAPTDAGVTEARWISAARELGSFSAAELGAELGVTKQVARKHIAELEADGRLVPDGMLGKTPTWRFAKPTDAGEAFEAQRRLQLVREFQRPAVEAVAGTGGHNPINQLKGSPDTKAAVRDAIAAGWMFRELGSGHFVLKLDGETVKVSKTPQNDSSHANRIRRQTRA